jgi:hypothetical protein
LISTSMIASGCQTSAGRPIICEPGEQLRNGRCYKVVPTKFAPHREHSDKGSNY